jgi:diaminopimelate epimerase
MFISKITASGNDFLITHIFLEDDYSSLAKTLCDRNYGVGADGFIVLLPSKECDIKWLFYNSDGSSASMCGNGTRAAGYYAYENRLSPSKLSLETKAGVIDIEVDKDSVKTAFTPPNLINDSVLELDREWMLVDTGVPHLVCIDEELDSLDMASLRLLREKYNANVNVGKVDGQEIFIRTYERGVEAETQACGTGMAALFYLLSSKDKVGDSAIITPASGEKLQFISEKSKIFFKGKVRKVFDLAL